MKRVVVTGGAGFLGSHCCDRLLRRCHQVLCVDNYYTGRRANISHLLDNPNFETMRHDITFPLHIEVDEIYNFACPASPLNYQLDPVQTLKSSVHGSINMLGLAKRTKAKIFQASTSEVYGDPEVSPQHENYWGNVNPLGPRSCYDEGKRCAETLFFDYHRQHRVNIRVGRIFNTFGPRVSMNDGRVISAFIVKALQGEDLPVAGDGMQTRSFCYVDDTLDAIDRLMDADDAVIGPINIGSEEERSILSVAETVIELTGSASKIAYIPLPEDDPKQRRPDTSRAFEMLGWRPSTGFEEGLKETIRYFKNELNLN